LPDSSHAQRGRYLTFLGSRRLASSVWDPGCEKTGGVVEAARFAPESPATIDGMVNRLAASTSPYLLQHADNPVDWWEWSPEALDKAKRRDVPILLSVGYAACRWCHVV
jgi:hypothetical protein